MNAPALVKRPTKPGAYERPSNADAADARLKALPVKAQEKFRRLRTAELRARALIDGLFNEAERIKDNLANLQRDLAIFDRRWEPEAKFEIVEDEKTGERKRVPAVFPERVALVEQIEASKAELQRIRQEQDAAHVGLDTASLLDWLAAQPPSTKFTVAPVAAVKLTSDALTRNRDAQAAVNRDLLAAENAPLTRPEAKAAMRAEIAALAEKGRPDVGGLFHGGGVEWPSELFMAGGHGAHQYTVAATVKDAFALAIWANADAIIAKLDAEIERMGDDATALSRDAQAARVAEGGVKLLQLLRQEEAIIEALEAQGQQVRRTCTDPLVLLGVERAKS